MRKAIPFIKKDLTARVLLSEVLFLKKEGKEVVIYTKYSLFRKKAELADFEKLLGDNFYKCHSYCIVNLDQVSKMCDKHIFFDEKKAIIIGRNNFIKTRKVFNEYLDKL